LWGTVAIAGLNEDFIEAKDHGDQPAVKRFIVNGANVNAKDEYGLPPLNDASKNGEIKVVQLLLAKGGRRQFQGPSRLYRVHALPPEGDKGTACQGRSKII
jgi:ankyrin repeat protein